MSLNIQLVKMYAGAQQETRYSPAECIFGRIHQTLKVTPAMEAGVTDHAWTLEEIVALAPIEAPKKRGHYKKRKISE